MLHQFLTANRVNLIALCREKVAARRQRSEIPATAAHGVPLFLQQLADTLRREESAAGPDFPNTEISRAAALHGAELLQRGYSVNQVVRDYGDVCQAVTELAVEQKATITTDEFRILNRCLDDAIADAVTAYETTREDTVHDEPLDLHRRLDAFALEQRRLLNVAIHSCAAIKTGSVGMAGATGTLLIHALAEMRALADRSLPEIRQAYSAPPLPQPA
ncbi:MAG: hypothetical protein ABI654_02725 [Betaproteobacteria bacterium]